MCKGDNCLNIDLRTVCILVGCLGLFTGILRLIVAITLFAGWNPGHHYILPWLFLIGGINHLLISSALLYGLFMNRPLFLLIYIFFYFIEIAIFIVYLMYHVVLGMDFRKGNTEVRTMKLIATASVFVGIFCTSAVVFYLKSMVRDDRPTPQIIAYYSYDGPPTNEPMYPPQQSYPAYRLIPIHTTTNPNISPQPQAGINPPNG